jgi:hypothetical protein
LVVIFGLTTAAAAGLGSGIIAAIIIAVIVGVVLLLVGGKKGYDMYAAGRQGAKAIQQNPLYEGDTNNKVNPLFSDNSFVMT